MNLQSILSLGVLSGTCNFSESRLQNTEQLIEKAPTAFRFPFLIAKHRHFLYFNPNMNIILTGMRLQSLTV